jgi:glutamine amidotransferase
LKTVALVDYGIGNTDSVRRALQDCGADVILAKERSEFEKASAIVLPGVGAFGDGMKHLEERGLVELLREQVQEKGIPFLGICLGMQLLAKKGFEDGERPGLGWLDADCARLKPAAQERVPHVGWNSVFVKGGPLLAGLDGRDFYFVHSYALDCRDASAVAGTTPYCGGFVSAVSKGHIHGVQFHPERSQKAGFAVLRAFLAL